MSFNNNSNDAFIRDLIIKHTPCFWLVKDDKHGFPSTFEYFITESRAVCADSGSLLLSDLDSPAALCRLLDSLDDTDSPTRIRLELKSPTSHFGQRSVRSIDDIPVYASVKAVVDADGELSAFEISYTTLFTFNGAYFFDLFGSHPGDIEHVTVRCDAQGRLAGVWFNAHRSCDGQWRSAGDVEIDEEETGRIVSFIARSGHGHYPYEGCTHRHFGTASDYTNRSLKWQPRVVIWVDGTVHRVASRGVNRELDGRGVFTLNPAKVPELDVDERHRYIVSSRIAFWGDAAGVAHQAWFSGKAEAVRSRTWLERVCTLLHLWDCSGD